MGGTIVCGVSGAAGHDAAELASALRARLGLRLVLVSVLDGVHKEVEDGAEEPLVRIARELGDAEMRVVVGDRAEALAQVAAEEGADLIVVGSRPAGLASRNFRSALASELEAVTPVPVLVAPPSTRKRSEQRLEVAINPS